MEKEQRPLLSANWWYCAHEKDMNVYIYIAYISKRIYIDIKTMHTEYFTFRCSLKKKDRIIYYHITDIEINRRYLIDITLYLYKLI